ncbi:hypothetical protein ACO2KH_18475 [Leptospira terpstrae]|uniref:hypothetical protein n=1 Tax=Leptospira terpstrae TaxID=293075 RepID=UPI003CFE4933
MKNYKKCNIFQNKSRIKILNEYRADVINYFNNIRSSFIEDVEENEISKKARMKINLVNDQVYYIIYEAQISSVISWTPPPIIGGYVKNIDLVNNIFNLHIYQLNPNHLIDVIDRSIGKYQRDTIPSLFRTINPLFYLFGILNYIMEFPFRFLTEFGFKTEKFENSLIGKIMKLFVFIFTFAASFLTVFDLLGYLEDLKIFIESLF